MAISAMQSSRKLTARNVTDGSEIDIESRDQVNSLEFIKKVDLIKLMKKHQIDQQNTESFRKRDGGITPTSKTEFGMSKGSSEYEKQEKKEEKIPLRKNLTEISMEEDLNTDDFE